MNNSININWIYKFRDERYFQITIAISLVFLNFFLGLLIHVGVYHFNTLWTIVD